MPARKTKTAARRPAGLGGLLNPKNVVLVGASDRPASWTARIYTNLKRYGFPKPIYPYNPGRDEVWGVPCYRSFEALPEAPDHLVVLVPAKAVPGVLREAAKAGARSATIMTSGFDELGNEEGRAAGDALRAAIRDTGLKVTGPNCFGNLVAPASMVTMPDDRPQRLAPGPVAIVGQSGGLCTAMKRTLEERGVDVGFVVTSGNEDGLTTADYIRHFVREPGIKVIVCYLEAIGDREGFLDGCRAARAAGKSVIVMKLGTSAQGRQAALAHTGALAGSIAAFDAVAGAAGAIRVGNLDEVVEAVELLLHAKTPRGGGLGAITLSGGLRGLLLDAAERNGLAFSPLSAKSQRALEKLVGVGAAVGNPLDGGYAVLSSDETYRKCVELMLADPGIDVLLLQEELPRAPGTERKERYLRMTEQIAARAKKPVVYVSMISYGLTEYGREMRAELPHLPFLQEVDKSLRTVGSIVRAVERRAKPRKARPRLTRAQAAAVAKLRRLARGAKRARALNEPDSKAILSAFGIASPEERVARTADGAVKAARALGLPVVLKAVSAELAHKSDAGAVLVGLETEAAVARGFETVRKNVAKAKPGLALDGVLVAPVVGGGLELALGLHNDPEVGPVVMFGQGGVALELYRDVAFASPDIDRAGALRLIASTHAGTLMAGFRGGPRFDKGAVADAVLGLARLAEAAGDVIASVDVNPFLARPRRGGAQALDGLIVVGRRTRDGVAG